MSITATEAAQVLRQNDATNAGFGVNFTPTYVWWVGEHMHERPLTASEIRKGRRFIEREALHRKALEAKVAAQDLAYERELLKERAAADAKRREVARTACQKVLAARG